jgi:hypothetical protein
MQNPRLGDRIKRGIGNVAIYLSANDKARLAVDYLKASTSRTQ